MVKKRNFVRSLGLVALIAICIIALAGITITIYLPPNLPTQERIIIVEMANNWTFIEVYNLSGDFGMYLTGALNHYQLSKNVTIDQIIPIQGNVANSKTSITYAVWIHYYRK